MSAQLMESRASLEKVDSLKVVVVVVIFSCRDDLREVAVNIYKYHCSLFDVALLSRKWSNKFAKM